MTETRFLLIHGNSIVQLFNRLNTLARETVFQVVHIDCTEGMYTALLDTATQIVGTVEIELEYDDEPVQQNTNVLKGVA